MAHDLVGRKFGSLIVVARDGCIGRVSAFRCRCECGGEVRTRSDSLLRGGTRSCGCLQKRATSKANSTHGKSQTPEYQAWKGIVRRTTDKKDANYPRYGGRGIKICDRWLASVDAFIDDMGGRPSCRHSVERVDNNGHYEPGNCIWATMKAQGRNKRSNRLLKFNGETRCLSEWCEVLGLAYGVAYGRLKRGWSIERAFTPMKPSETVWNNTAGGKYALCIDGKSCEIASDRAVIHGELRHG